MHSALSEIRQATSLAEQQTRILLIEDNAGDAELVRAMLELNEMSRAETVHCTRLADGVARLQNEVFQLVILDLDLPDSQGLETLRRVQCAAKMLPIVVFTGQEDLELSRNAMRLGAQECLCKSHFSGAILVRMIGNAVERQQILAATTASSLTDELTGIYNRRGLLTFAPPFFKQSVRLNKSIFLLYADLDGLKSINDNLGHEAGDRAICEAADVLRESFRESDLMSRLGGDEFVVLSLAAREDSHEFLCERVQSAVFRRNEQTGRDYRLSISLGSMAIAPACQDSLETLLHEADRRMYAKKKSQQRRHGVVGKWGE